MQPTLYEVHKAILPSTQSQVTESHEELVGYRSPPLIVAVKTCRAQELRHLFEAQLVLDDWRREYNHHRPHQSLDYMTPAEYARRWRTDNQPELA